MVSNYMNILIKYSIVLYKKSLVPKFSLFLTEINLCDFLNLWEQKLVLIFCCQKGILLDKNF